MTVALRAQNGRKIGEIERKRAQLSANVCANLRSVIFRGHEHKVAQLTRIPLKLSANIELSFALRCSVNLPFLPIINRTIDDLFISKQGICLQTTTPALLTLYLPEW